MVRIAQYWPRYVAEESVGDVDLLAVRVRAKEDLVLVPHYVRSLPSTFGLGRD